MDTNINDTLNVSSEETKPEEAIQKERKKPGPKPKNQVTQQPVVEVKLDNELADMEVKDEPSNDHGAKIEETKCPGVETHVESDTNVVDIKISKCITFRRPVMLYRGPSDKVPMCYISFAKISTKRAGEFVACSSVVPEIGKVAGYLYIDSTIRKLLSGI